LKTQINDIQANWINIKNKCRTTVNKDYTDNAPSSDFKQQLLISEHSPIRLLNIDWSWKQIKSWIATHWVRHKWECFVSTQRDDRTGVDRNKLPQEALVNFDGVANAQSCIDSWRKRLCCLAHSETRQYATDFKITLKPLEPELSDVLVPNCIYRCGCPEFKTCGYWNKFVQKYKNENLYDIKTRYLFYNQDFYEVNK
jgi:hypothetical protein